MSETMIPVQATGKQEPRKGKQEEKGRSLSEMWMSEIARQERLDLGLVRQNSLWSQLFC